MKPRDLFGVVIRSIGLLTTFVGLLYLCSAVVAVIAPQLAQGWSSSNYFGAGIVLLLIGIYFLRGASHLVCFAYGDEEREKGKTAAGKAGTLDVQDGNSRE